MTTAAAGAAAPELGVTLGPARQDSKAKRAVRLPAHDLRQRRQNLVVTDDEVITRMPVERQARMAKVPGDNAGLVLLVVVPRPRLLAVVRPRRSGYARALATESTSPPLLRRISPQCVSHMLR